jgi:hypothetical protein
VVAEEQRLGHAEFDAQQIEPQANADSLDVRLLEGPEHEEGTEQRRVTLRCTRTHSCPLISGETLLKVSQEGFGLLAGSRHVCCHDIHAHEGAVV